MIANPPRGAGEEEDPSKENIFPLNRHGKIGDKTYFMYDFFISVASVNVNGLRKGLKRNILFDYLELRKFSVIFLQETHSESGDVSLWSTQWKGKMYFCHGNRQSRGVAILVSEKSNLDVKKY